MLLAEDEESSFVGREAELAQLTVATTRAGSVVAVDGAYGIGKTALVSEFGRREAEAFPGGVHWIRGGSGFELADAVDPLAADLRRQSGRHLLVIDEVDRYQPGEVFETLSRLSTGPWDFSAILIGVEPRASGVETIKLRDLSADELAELVRRRAGDDLQASALDRLRLASRGNPRLFLTLLAQWEQGDRDPEAVTSLLLPWARAGVLGPDGSPLSTRSLAGRRLITDVREISSDVLQRAARSPESLHEMPSRRFEEMVAELLQRKGYTVTLTPATRDGGKDMYAARRDDVGSFIYVVECKRHHPSRPVGVGVVRALHGVAQHERVNAAMIVTTSSYSAPARSYARTIEYQMHLRDYFDLRRWLADYR